MELNEKAAKYLSKDPLTNCGALQVLRRGTGRALAADDRGALVHDETSGAYLLMSDDRELVMSWIRWLSGVALFCADDAQTAAAAQAAFGLKRILDCSQVVYTGQTPPVLKKSLRVSEVSDAEFALVRETYDKISDDGLRAARAAHCLWAGHAENGEFVGFIGEHPEGAIGMMHVFPRYRRRGCGEELEKFMLRRMARRGLFAFGYVEAGNAASEKLQRKLGMVTAPKHIHWVY